jgi:hypothetical protein
MLNKLIIINLLLNVNAPLADLPHLVLNIQLDCQFRRFLQLNTWCHMSVKSCVIICLFYTSHYFGLKYTEFTIFLDMHTSFPWWAVICQTHWKSNSWISNIKFYELFITVRPIQIICNSVNLEDGDIASSTRSYATPWSAWYFTVVTQ